MTTNLPYRLTACHMTLASELVPLAEVSIDALNDTDAIERAIQWARSLRSNLNVEAWLRVEQDGRQVHHEKFDGSFVLGPIPPRPTAT